MNPDRPTTLLAGLTPAVFMKRHWQKRPLLIRQAMPGVLPPVTRAELFDLAAHEGVESRLITRNGSDWTLRHGPLVRRALPALRKPQWTLLVQGLDLHVEAAHRMLQAFRFIPDARVDDLMISYASDGGGVGPHFDSYDVFLLQVHGAREWRIGRIAKPELQAGVPLKILTNFRAEQTWVLQPGDMLYLPPRWAHDGVARGECMTCSIGFRAPSRRRIATDVLQRLLDTEPAPDEEVVYADRGQAATKAAARIPAGLQTFAAEAVARELTNPRRLAVALGELLSEPKGEVVFDAGAGLSAASPVRLDRRTRMLYDRHHLFINGEAFRAAGRDARVLRHMANHRTLSAADLAQLSGEALELLDDWARSGWLRSADSTS